MGLILLSVIVVGVAMFAMAIGVIFSNRCLRGSCGGVGADSDPLACDTCPLRRAPRYDGRAVPLPRS